MTDITIAAGSFPHYEGPDDPEIWIISNKPYVTPDGKCITANSLPERTFVARGVCTVGSDRVLTTPELVVDATEDAIVNSDATLGAYLVTSQGRPISVLSVFKSFRVPASPTTTSWDLLAGATPPDVGDLPDVPATPTASEVSTAQVNFAFSASDGSISYKVKRSDNGGAFNTLAGSWTPGTNADTTVVAGHTYAYMVAGHNTAGDSA